MQSGRSLWSFIAVGSVCVALAAVVAIIMSPQVRPRVAMSISDATRLKHIEQARSAASLGSKSADIMPDALLRRMRMHNNMPEATTSSNEHASFYSILITQGLITPDMLYSVAERNPRVTVCTNYNYNSYNPATGTIWDPHAIRADLTRASNISFATVPLDDTPRRDTSFWKPLLNAHTPRAGNRGVRGGATSGPDFDASCTPSAQGKDRAWNGSLVFADGHVEWATSPVYTPRMPAAAAPLSQAWVDVLFRNDTSGLPATDPARNSDAFLVVQRSATAPGEFIAEGSPHITWD